MTRLWPLVCLCACSGDDKDPTPTGSATPVPVDSGEWTIGLPTDDTPFDDPRRGAETGLPPPDSADPEATELYLRHGGVAWSQLDVKRGHIKLTAGDFTCAELFDPGSALAEGVHTDIDPLHTDDLEPIWEGAYPVGNDRPNLVNTIVQFAGEGSPAPDDAVLTVHAWTDRGVLVSFESSVVSTTPIEVWNCGEKGPWGE